MFNFSLSLSKSSLLLLLLSFLLYLAESSRQPPQPWLKISQENTNTQVRVFTFFFGFIVLGFSQISISRSLFVPFCSLWKETGIEERGREREKGYTLSLPSYSVLHLMIKKKNQPFCFHVQCVCRFSTQQTPPITRW